MSAVALLDPQPGEKVCDLCAAPGGKTTQIAGRMGGEGFLLCNEINPKRAKILSRNIERMGVANALVTNEHPQRLAERLAGFFDRVLIDAPCSGEGMFRKEEAAVTDWSPETVEMCARRQAEILHSGAALVRPGGRLVYSTCTFAPAENEEAIAAFMGVSLPWPVVSSQTTLTGCIALAADSNIVMLSTHNDSTCTDHPLLVISGSNSGCSARKAATASSSSSGAKVQVEYTSRPPGRTSSAAECRISA